jgi:uncharacterized protein YfeS
MEINISILYMPPLNFMIRSIKYTYIIANCLALISCGGQNESASNTSKTATMYNNDLSAETAHPNAKKLLVDNFYWSPIDESGPFGNDDGSDAVYGFKDWRPANLSTSPVSYLKALIKDWGYETPDWYEMRPEKIEEFIETPVKVNMSGAVQYSKLGDRTLLGLDNAIIAVAFGQYAHEGLIDAELKNLASIALKRELLPVLLNRWDKDYQEKRKIQLQAMLDAVTKMEV